MEKVILETGWKFIDTAPDEGDAAAYSQPDFDVSGWMDIAVPGDVNDRLVKSGRMPDPHIGDNGRRCLWVTSREWWWRVKFATPRGDGRIIDLVLDGLDGHVDVWLNGKHLGQTKNAFRKFRFAITEKLAPAGQENVLLFRFGCMDKILGGQREDETTGWGARRVLMRKPQFSMGWDWSLPLPSIGVQGSAAIERHDGARFMDVGLQAHLSGRVDVHYRLVSPPPAEYEVVARVRGHGADVTAAAKNLGGRSYVSLQVPDVQLWYPSGMGEQPLYEYEVELRAGGQVTDVRRGRIGFREVRILEEPFTPDAGHGMSFWLAVNGKRVFCKGGNWIPLELWPATVRDEQYRFYLGKTVEANFNMQRIWGGGIYERDIFYDLCDELGIMVWQDFMFASHGYPVDLLRDEIISETDYQIRRLRNHASVVLWCGINEDAYSWSPAPRSDYSHADANTGKHTTEYVDGVATGSLKDLDRYRDDPQIYSMICRGTVSRLGFGVPYVESSPMSLDDAGNMPNSGNCHISCWKYCLFETGKRYERFRDHFGRVCSFDSEFCIQGPPCLRTMEQFLPASNRWPPDDVWLYHIQRGHANLPHHEQTLMIAGATFGPIDSLETYCKHGQATHAEHMRAEFESARRDRPNNGGTMMWMYNDCWPTANWSIIDYWRHPKAAYYSAKRACTPLLPIIFERGGFVEFFFSNDSSQSCTVELTFGQERLNSEAVWSRRIAVTADSCSTARFCRLPRQDLTLAVGDYLFIDAAVGGQQLPRVTYFPGMWLDVPWPKPQVTLRAGPSRRRGDCWLTELIVSTDAYARFCHMMADDALVPWFDDNYFDLSAGRSHRVLMSANQAISASDVHIGHWHTAWK